MRTTIILSFIILLGLLSTPSFAQQISAPKNLDHPGIKWDWKIKAENYTFNVITVSNYEMNNVTFNKNNKELIFSGNSTHGKNIAEIEIPHNLIGGNFTITEDGKPLSAIVISGTNSTTVMLQFNKTGQISTSIVGTTYLPEFSGAVSLVMLTSIGMILFILKMKKI